MRLLVDLLEVLELALGISLDRGTLRLPVGGADLAVLVGELESLDEPDGLVDRAADGEVVDGDLAERSLGVDQEQAAEGDTGVLDQDVVGARDGQVLVGDELEVEVGAEPALVARGVGPREVRVLRVGRDGKDLGVERGKVGELVVEGEDLSLKGRKMGTEWSGQLGRGG